MKLRTLILCLVSLAALSGCTSNRVMRPRTASLEAKASLTAPTAETQCVGEVCFVSAVEE